MGINRRLHDVEVALGLSQETKVEEETNREYGDIFNHTLYGIHITNKNDALSEDNPHICIGWSSLGDLSVFATKDELSLKYDEIYPDQAKRGKAQNLGQIWRFCHDAQIGDFVILGESAKFHIGIIVSDYYFDNSTNNSLDTDYVNHRKVKWLKTNIDRTILSESFHHSLGSAMSFFTLNDYKAAVLAILDGTYKKDEDVLVDENYIENVVDYDNAKREKGGENVILYGVPGAGKSWSIKKDYCDDASRMERLVFHPDYTYSDFVGQILPKIDKDNNISYVFTPGPFTTLVKKAYQNPDKMYFLVIEEVNRGNAPAIFGDIFQLLDRNADGTSEYEITNADIASIVYGDASHKVSIPSNLSILCTMNTSDQNVFTLDTAFQRRWNMRLIQNKFHDDEPKEQEFAKSKILDTTVTWERFFTEINKIILDKNIRMTSSEDKRLGTHFVSLEDLKYEEGNNKQNSRFPEKVLKYLWDDAFKFTKEDVFDLEKVKSLEDVIQLFLASSGNERFRIFKENIFNTVVVKNTSEGTATENN